MTATHTAPTIAGTTAEADDAVMATNRAARLAAGIGAIGFATVVLATNAVVGSTPALDAPADEVARFVADKHDQLALSAAAYTVGFPFLLAFVCGIARRLRGACRPQDRVVADIGVASALLILPFFAAVVVQRIVMTVGADERIADPDLLAFGWRLEGAAFGLNLACIAVAVVGIGTAASRAGLLPSWFRFLSWFAGPACLAGAILTVPGLEGAPIMPLGLAGFLTWMVMLLTIGVRQLRAAD